MNLSEAIGAGLLLGLLHGAAQAAPVTPSFTTGTVTSHSETHTVVTESIRQIDYMTGSQYTVSGTNISWDGPPVPGANYVQTIPDKPFSSPSPTLDPASLG